MPVDGRQMNVNTGRIENAGVEAEIAYRISAAWSVDANYSFLHMEHPVLAAPEHKLHVGASFMQGRWSVSTGLQYVEGLYTSIVVGGTGSDAQENFILWNLRAGFRISRKLRIFVDGENPAGAALRDQRRIPPCRVQPCWAVWTCTFNELLEIPELSFNHS